MSMSSGRFTSQGSRRFRLVAVGGTFDRLHVGHERLLEKAFQIGEKIIIGITTDDFARRRDGFIYPLGLRKLILEEFLRERGFSNYEIIEIRDRYGPAVDLEELEAIVVSKETEPVAREINEIRKRRGLRELEVVTIEMVLGEDGEPVSSSRIRRGEIDVKGCLIDASGCWKQESR